METLPAVFILLGIFLIFGNVTESRHQSRNQRRQIAMSSRKQNHFEPFSRVSLSNKLALLGRQNRRIRNKPKPISDTSTRNGFRQIRRSRTSPVDRPRNGKFNTRPVKARIRKAKRVVLMPTKRNSNTRRFNKSSADMGRPRNIKFNTKLLKSRIRNTKRVVMAPAKRNSKTRRFDKKNIKRLTNIKHDLTHPNRHTRHKHLDQISKAQTKSTAIDRVFTPRTKINRRVIENLIAQRGLTPSQNTDVIPQMNDPVAMDQRAQSISERPFQDALHIIGLGVLLNEASRESIFDINPIASMMDTNFPLGTSLVSHDHPPDTVVHPQELVIGTGIIPDMFPIGIGSTDLTKSTESGTVSNAIPLPDAPVFPKNIEPGLLDTGAVMNSDQMLLDNQSINNLQDAFIPGVAELGIDIQAGLSMTGNQTPLELWGSQGEIRSNTGISPSNNFNTVEHKTPMDVWGAQGQGNSDKKHVIPKGNNGQMNNKNLTPMDVWSV